MVFIHFEPLVIICPFVGAHDLVAIAAQGAFLETG